MTCLGVAVVLVAVTLALLPDKQPSPLCLPSVPSKADEPLVQTGDSPDKQQPAPSQPSPAKDERPRELPPSVDFDWRATLLGSNTVPRLPREIVEAYLQQHQRNVESLLAAYHALDDTNLLIEAAARFSNDTRVQWTVLSRDLFPEERRKWIELFKASAPDNSLANYLSTQEHLNPRYHEETKQWLFGSEKLSLQHYLKTDQAQAAINDLLEAAGKPRFKDYSMDIRLEEEALNLAAGRSVLQSRLGSQGWASDVLSDLAKFKNTAIGLKEIEKCYLNAGDTASAQNLTELGLTLANRLREGESAMLGINQLVGMASEALLLSAWDADTRFDFLGDRTPKERLAELKQARTALRELARAVDGQFAGLPEADVLSYLDRERLYGEFEAMRWLQARSQTSAAPAP